MKYPTTRTVEQADLHHGVRVADPYRWLEDTGSAQTRDWIAAQNRVSASWLDAVPQRLAIGSRLKQIWNYERQSVPVQRGGQYFYTCNDGLRNQPVLRVADRWDSEGRVLLDPNAIAADGTVALAQWAPSNDGRLVAYALSGAGSDWQEWRVRDVRTGRDTADHLRHVKFSGAAWRPDGSGFYYNRYDAPAAGQSLSGLNHHQKLCFHRLGTPQAQDELVYHNSGEKEWGYGSEVTEDGRHLVITVRRGTDPRNRVFYKPLGVADAPVTPLVDQFEAAYAFVGSEGDTFWFRTDLNATRGRVVAIDLARPNERTPVVVESQDTLRHVSMIHGEFVCAYLRDARSVVRIHGKHGQFVREVGLPGIGTAGGFGGRGADKETFYSFTSFNQPPTVHRLDLAGGNSTVVHQPRLEFNPADYVTRQVSVRSRDGTRLPMFMAHRRGLKPDGNLPTLLYGYGGFNISLTPQFSPMELLWMEMGGVYAMPNLRGGGEYGEAWHRAGTRLQKQNVFDDFIACAEWLQANLYTRPEKLAIAGGSNGGLLVGACMTQRPELFGAALPAVGVMDMLRFHKFTIGWAWTSDYGSPENAEEFKALHAYSPYHNLKPGTRYPATLVTTGDHDDRVVPGHSFKFAARLQASHAGDAPVLLRVGTRTGHGAGKSTAQRIEEDADKLAFLVRVLGMEPTLRTATAPR